MGVDQRHHSATIASTTQHCDRRGRRRGHLDVLLTFLDEGQQATVPKTVTEAEAQRRATYVG